MLSILAPRERSTDAATVEAVSPGGRPRLIGVDVARGLALIGMIASHSFDTIDDTGNPTLVHAIAGGRSAATFVLVAGVSLAFLSGRTTPRSGPERNGIRAGLAVRAVLIGAMGLALGLLYPVNGVEGILPVYGLMFLLAIPLLYRPPLSLIGIAAALIALAPVLIVATADAELPYAGVRADPTFSTLVHDPVGLLVQLFLTGVYPAVVYLSYLCVGLAIGRLDLSARRVGWWLLGGGLALAVLARGASALLLYRMGGLARLLEAGGLGNDPEHVNALLWEESKPPTSWWYLAVPAPHAYSPIDLLHTLGSAAAVLGAALLLTRVPLVARLLWPLAAVGSMSLTLYSAHLVFLATPVPEDQDVLLFVSMLAGTLVLATAWRWRFRQGPLEKLVAVPATAARLAVTRLTTPTQDSAPTSRTRRVLRSTARGGAQILGPVVCAVVLGLTFWAGTAYFAPPGDGSDNPAASAAVAELSGSNEQSLDAGDLAPPSRVPPATAAGPQSSTPAADPAGDIDRYCELADQLYTLDEGHPNQPQVVAVQGATQLAELPQVAPVQIHDAVTTVVDSYRADAAVPGVAAPDQGILLRAEATVEAFEDEHC